MPKSDLTVRAPWADVKPEEPTSAPSMSPAKGTPSLLEPEFAPAYHAYAASPSPQNASTLLTAIKPVLNEAVRSYAGGESTTATTMANAKRLALEAARRYDPSRAKLRTHLLSHLRGLRRQAARSIGGVYVPEAWRIDAQRIDAATPELRDEIGRSPSDAELSDRTGIPLTRVRKARMVPGVLAGSQVEGTPNTGAIDEKAWNQWVDVVYADSSPVDQAILDHAFGLHGKPVLTGGQLAHKLNLSAGAISQRKARIQGLLDEYDSFMGNRG